MQNATGPIETDDAQLSYQNIDYLPFGTSVRYQLQEYPVCNYIHYEIPKGSNDPRLPIYFEQNDLTGHSRIHWQSMVRASIIY